jgi:hypothetical protein
MAKLRPQSRRFGPNSRIASITPGFWPQFENCDHSGSIEAAIFQVAHKIRSLRTKSADCRQNQEIVDTTAGLGTAMRRFRTQSADCGRILKIADKTGRLRSQSSDFELQLRDCGHNPRRTDTICRSTIQIVFLCTQ